MIKENGKRDLPHHLKGGWLLPFIPQISAYLPQIYSNSSLPLLYLDILDKLITNLLALSKTPNNSLWWQWRNGSLTVRQSSACFKSAWVLVSIIPKERNPIMFRKILKFRNFWLLENVFYPQRLNFKKASLQLLSSVIFYFYSFNNGSTILWQQSLLISKFLDKIKPYHYVKQVQQIF